VHVFFRMPGEGEGAVLVFFLMPGEGEGRMNIFRSADGDLPLWRGVLRFAARACCRRRPPSCAGSASSLAPMSSRSSSLTLRSFEGSFGFSRSAALCACDEVGIYICVC
jgi:hypothetical protein